MAVFTSAYKALAHGALNWDIQLDADMGTLETILDQGAWTPGFGGTAASLGTGGSATGYFTRLGQHVTYNGRLLFGSSCTWGTGTPAITGAFTDGNINTAFTIGRGIWSRNATGALVPVICWPLSASSFSIYAVQAGGSSLPTTVAALGQSDQIIFQLDGTLA